MAHGEASSYTLLANHNFADSASWAATSLSHWSVAAYVGSMAGTLYAAVSLHSYVLSLVFCVAQV